MAYRYEKEPNGDMALVIDGWENAISSDPYSGMNYMLSVDLETPGEVAVGYGITTSATSGATLGTPIARSTMLFSAYASQTPNGSPKNFAILDANGRVWQSSSITGTFTFLSSSNSVVNSSNLDGIAYYMGYLLKSRADAIDYWNGSTWANMASGITNFSAAKHYFYIASNNVLYITNGNYVASLEQIAGQVFDPGNTGTFTFSGQKLQLPVTDAAVSLAEVGGGNTPQSTLLVGGIFNSIYPWDKVSSSFALPIYVADSYIGKMVSVNQNVFIFPGNTSGRGRIYITNGSQADLYFKIPDYIFGTQDPYYEWGDVIFNRNNLIFGFFITNNSTASLIQNFAYVWALNLSSHTAPTGVSLPEKAFRAISTLPSSATAVANATCLISTLNLSTPGFGFIVAWDNNGSVPGIGYSGTTAGIGTSSILTDLMPTGTFLQKKTFTQVEYKLRTALASGESIQVSPVVDGSVGSPLTFSPTVAAGQLSGYAPVNWEKAQWLQFLVNQTGNSGSSGCRLREIRLR